MAYAKFIKKNGKKIGPYYYKSVRTKDGKVRTIYLGRAPSGKRQGLSLFRRLLSAIF